MLKNNLIWGGLYTLLNNLFNPMLSIDDGDGGGGNDPATGADTAAKEAPGWTKGLKADFQSNEYFTSKATVSDLAEDALSMRTKLERSVVIPGENATDEEKTTYREKLGVPKTKDDYKFGDLAENEFLGWFRSKAHDLNMSQDSAGEMVGSFNEFIVEAQAKEKESNNKAIEAKLKEKWKDGFDTRITRAQNFAKKYGGEDFKVDNLEVIEMLDTFAGLVSEDSFGGGLGGQGGWSV